MDVLTDHKPLTYLETNAGGFAAVGTAKLERKEDHAAISNLSVSASITL